MIAAAPSTPAVFPNGSGGPIELDGFDATLTFSPAWQTSYQQVGRGIPRVRVTFAHAPRLELAVISRTPGLLVRGAPPPGTVVLAVNLRGSAIQLQGHPWARGTIGFVPMGGEFELISTTPHALFALCVDHATLNLAAEQCWGRPLPLRHSGPGFRVRNEVSHRRLVATWARWLQRARRPLGLPTEMQAHMEQEVVGAFLENVDPGFRVPPPNRRRDVAVRAEVFLRGRLDEPVSVADVCAAVHTSRPTLHAIFRDVFGVSPMAYWKALRLSAVRRELARARRGTTVEEIALKWGFSRLGHFSADYRAMFGEYPRETIRRDGRRVPQEVKAPRGLDPPRRPG